MEKEEKKSKKILNFVIKTMNEYQEKTFVNATDKELNLDTEEDKTELEKINKE